MVEKKALLTLFGERSFLPTALTLLYEKPAIIVAISSKESHRDIPLLERAIEKYKTKHGFSCQLETPDGIDAFDVVEIQRICESAVGWHPDTDWLFDVTGATSLMTLSTYEAAKAHSQRSMHSVKCWYLNTAQTRVISLIGEVGSEELFMIDVEDYITAYNRDLLAGQLEDQRQSSEHHWLPFAQRLGKDAQAAALMSKIMSKIANRPGKENPKLYTIKNLPAETYSLLEEAQKVGLLSQLSSSDRSSLSFQLTYFRQILSIN